MVRAFLTWVLVLLEVFLAAGAFYGGVQLLRDPTGVLMQLPAEHFLPASSVFHDWTVPAVVLMLANGVFPLVVVVATVLKQPWTELAHAAVGVVLTGWMVVQALVVGFSATIQIAFLALGLVIFALGLLRYALAEEDTGHPGQHPV